MSKLIEFMEDIKTNNLKSFYLFTGEEIGLMNVYISRIPEPVYRVTSVQEALPSLTQKSLLGNKKIYAVRDDMDFIKNESRWKRIADIKHGTLIFLVTKLDGRSKFLKTFADEMVQFDKMTAPQLLNHFKKTCNFSDKLLSKIIELCNRDYSRIENEIDKLNRVKLPTEKAIDNLIAHTPEFDIFQMVNHVIRYEKAEAFEMADVMLVRGENILGFLTLLYNQFAGASRVLGTDEAKESNTGIKQFTVNMIKKNFNYSLDGAIEGMIIIGDMIEGIKGGLYTETVALYLCLYKIFELV